MRRTQSQAHKERFMTFLERIFFYCSRPIKTKIRRIKTVGNSFVMHHLVSYVSLVGKENIMFSTCFNQHLISANFLTPVPPCYGCCRHSHIYYIWCFLFPLVEFCTPRQYLSLNEIGYGNVECCSPVVSADVVELGSLESRTYSSEKQTLYHSDTLLQIDTCNQTYVLTFQLSQSLMVEANTLKLNTCQSEVFLMCTQKGKHLTGSASH